MGRKSKFSPEEKLEYVLRCIEGKDSFSHAAKLIGVGKDTMRRWVSNYKSLGINGLNTISKNFSHSSHVKEMAVSEYLSGKGSLHDICFEYGIRSTGMLHTWVMKYNSHEKLKSSGTGGVSIMTKGRKTDFDERVEIVKYCIENKHNYAETAQKFKVSYQQVNSWTNKYLKQGIDALQDKRGKRKTEDEMSEMDKLKAQNKLLEAEILQKQMEIDFLKKLEEIQRRRS